MLEGTGPPTMGWPSPVTRPCKAPVASCGNMRPPYQAFACQASGGATHVGTPGDRHASHGPWACRWAVIPRKARSSAAPYGERAPWATAYPTRLSRQSDTAGCRERPPRRSDGLRRIRHIPPYREGSGHQASRTDRPVDTWRADQRLSQAYLCFCGLAVGVLGRVSGAARSPAGCAASSTRMARDSSWQLPPIPPFVVSALASRWGAKGAHRRSGAGAISVLQHGCARIRRPLATARRDGRDSRFRAIGIVAIPQVDGLHHRRQRLA